MIKFLRYFGAACIIIGLLLDLIGWVADGLLLDIIAKVILVVGYIVYLVWLLFLKRGQRDNSGVSTDE